MSSFDSSPSSSKTSRSLFERLLQLQIVRFCLVGASSTVIDKGIFSLLLALFDPHFWAIFMCIAFLFGVTNGFYWNRRWTFEQGGQSGGQKQYAKFVITNTIGLALNLTITKGFLILFLGHINKPAPSEKWWVLLASLCAIPLVVVWNFTASRFWTFRKPKTLPESGAVAQK